MANHLAGRGESVADLPWDVEYDVKQSDEGWREEWLALLEEANIESHLDCVRFIRWLKMPLTSGEKKTGAGGLAQVALEALESVGQVVPASSVHALERAMAASEAGSTTAQCVDNPALIGALYMGKSSLSQDSVEFISSGLAALDGDAFGVLDIYCHAAGCHFSGEVGEL